MSEENEEPFQLFIMNKKQLNKAGLWIRNTILVVGAVALGTFIAPLVVKSWSELTNLVDTFLLSMLAYTYIIMYFGGKYIALKKQILPHEKGEPEMLIKTYRKQLVEVVNKLIISLSGTLGLMLGWLIMLVAASAAIKNEIVLSTISGILFVAMQAFLLIIMYLGGKYASLDEQISLFNKMVKKNGRE